MTVQYRLSAENHKRISTLSTWLHVGPDLLLKKMLECQLQQAEEVRENSEFVQELETKYQLAESLKLLED